MRVFLVAIGTDIRRIIFSRKFLVFGAVIVSAWYGLQKCIENENPTAIALYGVFAGMISSAGGIYSFVNAKESVARAGASPSPPLSP